MITWTTAYPNAFEVGDYIDLQDTSDAGPFVVTRVDGCRVEMRPRRWYERPWRIVRVAARLGVTFVRSALAVRP